MPLEKITGAAAARGDDLAAVTAIAERVIGTVRSMGVALTPCIVPHSGEPSFVLADDEIEMGIGIHREPGRHRMKIEPADDLVADLLDPVVEDLPFERGDRTLLMVNGIGGRRCSSSTSPTASPPACSKSKGSRSADPWSNYITSLRCRVCR